MTKEEIFNHHSSEADNWNNALFEKDALIAMDEYAKQQTIAFETWRIENAIEWNHRRKCYWKVAGSPLENNLETIEDFYFLFLESQNK
jgi:hypothetical protein